MNIAMHHNTSSTTHDATFAICSSCILFHCIHGLSIIDPKKFRKTPSAASIFPKVFRRSHFRTSILSDSQEFFESCANSNRENNKIISCNKRVILRA